MILSNLIIYCMAVWRISSLLVNESGPWYVFQKFRKLFGIRHDLNDVPTYFPDNVFAQMFSCVWCTSIWVALFMFIFVSVSQYWAFRLGVIMAFSTGAIILDSLIKYLRREQ